MPDQFSRSSPKPDDDDTAQAQAGFTLIELSIVLVIIGLLVGGVLVGRDLINAAQIRATVSQIEKYQSAVNTFRVKYNAMPGDITAAIATQFGFATRTGDVGRGDGNSFLQACSTGTSANKLGCETALFWRDLGDANLINGSFPLLIDDVINIPAGQQATYLPESKLSGNYFTVIYDSYIQGNGYAITGLLSTNAFGVYSTSSLLTPNEAYSIDKKIDNGAPFTGNIIFADGVTLLAQGAQPIIASPITTCAVYLAPTYVDPYNAQYATMSPYGDTKLCELIIKF